MKKRYIIVGGGYAGMFLSLELLKRGIDFVLYSDPQHQPSSIISAGVCNPVVLKRFTTFDLAEEQLKRVREIELFFKSIIGKGFIIPNPVSRVFHDEKEKEVWWAKSFQNEGLRTFLNPEVNKVDEIPNPYGVGKVQGSFRIDVAFFFSEMEKLLDSQNKLYKERFDYTFLEKLSYKGQEFSEIIFAEGKGIKQNPWFNFLPIELNKGHQFNLELKMKDPELTLKKKHFLFPLKKNTWYYGGTYDRHDQEEGINERAVSELKTALIDWVGKDRFRIENIFSGFRPTVPDRKPLIGAHPDQKNYYVFNGMGARGVMNAAWYAMYLIDFIEKKEPIPPEADWRRYA